MKIKELYNYLLIVGYFSYLLFLIKISVDSVNQTYLLLGLMPLALIAIINYSYKKAIRFKLLKSSTLILLFYLAYFFISNYNSLTFIRGVTLFFIMLLHVVCIMYFIFENKNLRDIKYTVFGFLIISVFVVFLPSYSIVGSLKLGGFYNLSNPSLLTTTTVEGPLIVALLFLLSFFDLTFNKKRTVLNIGCILFSAFVLLLFNRRGFIFSCALSVLFYYLISRANSVILTYALFIIMFLPMYWDAIASVLSNIMTSDLLSSFLVRNKSEEILTASGRSIGWHNILNLYYSADSRFLFGYYGPIPTGIFLSTVEGGRYQHAHNTILQLFLEAGYFINLFFIVMLGSFFTEFIKKRREDSSFSNFYFLIIIFLFVLASTETLIKYINFSNFIFCYALIGLHYTNIYGKDTIKLRFIKTDINQPS